MLHTICLASLAALFRLMYFCSLGCSLLEYVAVHRLLIYKNLLLEWQQDSLPLFNWRTKRFQAAVCFHKLQMLALPPRSARCNCIFIIVVVALTFARSLLQSSLNIRPALFFICCIYSLLTCACFMPFATPIKNFISSSSFSTSLYSYATPDAASSSFRIWMNAAMCVLKRSVLRPVTGTHNCGFALIFFATTSNFRIIYPFAQCRPQFQYLFHCCSLLVLLERGYGGIGCFECGVVWSRWRG